MSGFREKLPLPSSEAEGLGEGFREARLLRDVVCYNQGALFEYHFIGARLHRELRQKWHDSTKRLGPSRDSREADEIRKLLSEMLDFLDRKFLNIVECNFAYLQDFLAKANNSENHRIALMVPTDRAGIGVIDLYRYPMVSESFGIRATDKYTAFSSVKNTGRHYICNNIPLEFRNGKYKNPRLKDNLIVPEESIHTTASFDLSWFRMWRSFDPGRLSTDPLYFRSFYKSTAVIPLTFINNAKTFSREFFLEFNGDDLRSSIFGYLSMDSTEIEYFNNPACIDIGYVIADHLCYLMILRRMYTLYSSTFNEIMGNFGDTS